MSSIKEHNKNINPDKQSDANLDPISGEVGAHPVGTGVGAAGAGTVATVIGGATAFQVHFLLSTLQRS